MGIRVHWFALALSFPALHAHAHSAARVARAPLVARTGIARVAVRCAAKGGGTGTGGDEGARAAAGSRGGLRLLEWVPSQQLLVLTAKWVWRTLFRVMLSELAPQSDAGAYMRPTPQAGANAAPDGRWPASLPHPEPGRYHLYVGNACPWCHRAIIAGSLKGLFGSGLVGISVLLDDPQKASRGGWAFEHRTSTAMPTEIASIWDLAIRHDPLFGAADLRGVYDGLSEGSYTGRCTAPLLVDLKDVRIVSSESAEIVRLLGALDAPSSGPRVNVAVIDLYPEALRTAIDAANEWIYTEVNNGVYQCGFATQQGAYEQAEQKLHAALERLDAMLASSKFVAGAQFTEADVRLLPTIARFDGMYATLFRCGRKTVRADYSNIHRWLCEMRALRGLGSLPLSATLDLVAAQRSYYTNLFPLNPSGIVPALPESAADGLPPP
mmetsp:Transcript_26917/g.66396  ORF Transcript_26917/g.66396 Transcript_26917/m.66396 type:complete len:438 (+) Transcript_26917:166-1479(+)